MEPEFAWAFDLTIPEHAYLFGFLQTDGHHFAGTGQRGKISIEVNVRDRPVLEAFSRIVPHRTNITTRTRSTNFADHSETAVWTLCSLDARKQLLQLGLPTGRKSRTITPPTREFSRIDYLRAIVDADGSIGFTAKGYPFIGLVTASEALSEHFCTEVARLTGLRRTGRRNSRDDVFNILVAMEPAVELASLLYYPDCLALPRKADVAERLRAWTRPATMRARSVHRAWTAEEDRIVLREEVRSAAEILGRTTRSVNMRRWRLRNGAAPTARELARRERVGQTSQFPPW